MLGQRQGVLVMKVCRACQGHRHSAGRCWLSQTQKLLAWKSRTRHGSPRQRARVCSPPRTWLGCPLSPLRSDVYSWWQQQPEGQPAPHLQPERHRSESGRPPQRPSGLSHMTMSLGIRGGHQRHRSPSKGVCATPLPTMPSVKLQPRDGHTRLGSPGKARLHLSHPWSCWATQP